MNPRALPPVTQSSALQAPECMWGTCDVIAFQAPECMRRPIRPIRGGKEIQRTGNSPPGEDIVVAPGEPIFYCHRQLFCFLGA